MMRINIDFAAPRFSGIVYASNVELSNLLLIYHWWDHRIDYRLIVVFTLHPLSV